MIKSHKLHLASDRTSCTSAAANQFRLLLHTAADLLLPTLRGLAPKTSFWRDAQFDTIRLALIEIVAGMIKLKTRIKLALPTWLSPPAELGTSRRPGGQATALTNAAKAGLVRTHFRQPQTRSFAPQAPKKPAPKLPLTRPALYRHE